MKRIILTGFILLVLSTICYAQTVTLHKQNISLKQLFDEIRKQTGYDFLYSPQLLTKAKPVDVDAVNSPLKMVLDNCFTDQPLTYVIDKKTIIVKEKQVERYSAWSVIKGRIINKENGSLVPNASVFLSNNTGGAASNTDGTFTLTNIKPGNYELVVSLVGFEIWRQPVNVTGANIDLPDIKLARKAIGLKEVVVKAGADKNWSYRYNLFKQAFLGNSKLAGECRILDPEALDLGYDDKTSRFTASSSDFLVIQNDALGYRLKYLLTAFSCDNAMLNVSYKGSVLFEEMKGSASQEDEWVNKRKQTYERSQMHFLRALLSDQLDEEGFRALRYTYKKSKKTLLRVPLTQKQLLNRTDVPGVYALGIDSSELYVEHNEHRRFHENDKLSVIINYSNVETSIVSFDKHYILFDQNGWVINPDEIVTAGAWARCRVAEMLPANYEPFTTGADNRPMFIRDDAQASKILLDIKSRSDSLLRNIQAEKIYARLDKSEYAAGDTIWFKAWVFDALMLSLSAQSGVLHIDIADGRSNVVRKYVFHIKDGVASGQLPLDTSVFKEGNYTLRAYTNWMRNFGDETFFYKPISIVNADGGHWLVSTAFRKAGDSVIDARLRLASLNGIPVVDSTLIVKAVAGTSSLLRQRIKTDDKGIIDLKVVNLKAAKIDSIVIENTSRSKKAIIPVTANREIDLQFMPEGGSLLNGINCRVGFKAIDNSGKSVDVAGIVVDRSGRQVAAFKSAYRGMGSFDLKPEKGQVYSARLLSPKTISKTYQLPTALNSGLNVSVRNDMQKDSLDVVISSTSDIPVMKATYFLIGRSRGVICYAATVHFEKEALLRRRIAKSLFPTGIAHLMLVAANNDPISDRPVYIDHHDGLHIEIQPDRKFYAIKDSIALNIKVTDSNGEPVQGNFCLAANDNTLVKADTLNDITSHVFLSSDLKGYIENPGYYLKNDTTAWKALDNLLLTQGWVNYATPAGTLQYQPEINYKVSGKVKNIAGNGIKNLHLLLLSKLPEFLRDTTTDRDGHFSFDHLPDVDTPIFFLQSDKRHFNLTIDVNEVPAPSFNAPAYPRNAPWYVNADSTLMNYVHGGNQSKDAQYYNAGGHRLKEVKITAKKTIKSSENLNGSGEADVVIDEKDLEQAGKQTLLDLLQQNVKGFHDRVVDISSPDKWYFINDRMAFLFVDGVYPGMIYPSFDFFAYNSYLRSLKAEDVRGMEVMTSVKYVDSYVIRYANAYRLHIDPTRLAIIEVTTRAGHGPALDVKPDTYLYRPLAFTQPLQFYKPRYVVNDTSVFQDSRPTVDWEPNIVTDANGEAKVSFFSGTNASTYTILVEGTDLNGNIGSQRKELTIGQAKDVAKSK